MMLAASLEWFDDDFIGKWAAMNRGRVTVPLCSTIFA